MSKILKIRGSLKNYEWGKQGSTSKVASLYFNKNSSEVINQQKPYAELWMGTHPSGPSIIPSKNNLELLEWISNHPDSLGSNILQNFDSSKGLPFLFKVLSVKKALSIQAHPDKGTAVKLFRDFPDIYPDDNHKTEMAIALTEFEALCSFRPTTEIKSFFDEIPQLQEIIGQENYEFFKAAEEGKEVEKIFSTTMTCPPETYQPILIEIIQNIKNDVYSSNLSKSISKVFLKTCEQYPGDIGNFCFFFLNYIKLKPEEAIFLAANEPHAYLSGDCIECMACSDNVVRAGLTPKFRDVQTLCKILTYNCRSASDTLFQPKQDENDPSTKIYKPPVPEFVVDCIKINENFKEYRMKPIKSASILLVVEGNGYYKETEEEELEPGSILFIPSDTGFQIHSSSPFLMYRAYCEP